MSKANAIFIFNGINTIIQCTKNDKMKIICQKFVNKIESNLNSLLFLYGGNQLDFEKNFQEQASSIDNERNEMKVLVYIKVKDEYVCPKCGEKIKLEQKDLNEVISSNNNIKDIISGIKIQLDNIIKNSLNNLVNIQINNVNIILNKVIDDIQKNNEKIKNLLNFDYNNSIEIKKKNPLISSAIKIEQFNKMEIYLFPKFKFNELEEQTALKIMFLGEKNSGITTIINSFTNFLVGVDIKDNFRYKLIRDDKNQEEFHTNIQLKEFNEYNIKSIEKYPPIKIIDTPIFDNNEDIKETDAKLDFIKKIFSVNISEINSICFVIKSNVNITTLYCKYIYNKLLEIFGKDIKENIIFILTFCNEELSYDLQSLKSEDSPFRNIIESKNYFKFNKFSFFDSSKNDENIKILFNSEINSFNKLIEKMKNIPKNNLLLSKEVIKGRKLLKEKESILFDKIKNGLNKVEEIKESINKISKIKEVIEDTKNYKQKIKQPVIKKIVKPPGFYSLTCLYCTCTCMPNVRMTDSDDEESIMKALMDKNDNCKKCPKKCNRLNHKLRDYILVDEMEDKEIILEDLKKRHFDEKNKLEIETKRYLAKKKSLKKIWSDCVQEQELICLNFKNFQEKSLIKNMTSSNENYINLLIEKEEKNNRIDKSLVKKLKLLKEKRKSITEIYKNNNSQINQIKNFINNLD